MESSTHQAMHALKAIPGKGKGLVATERIPKGTRILCEQALFTISSVTSIEERKRLICQQVEALSNGQRDVFLSMRNVRPCNNTAERYLDIFQTNSLPAEDVPETSAIFLEACRINHDCDHNAVHQWNDNIKRHTVHAVRDIPKGKEITTSYIPYLRNREWRQRTLQQSFDFACSCRICSLPADESEERDRILEQISRLYQLCVAHPTASPLVILAYIHAQTRLWIELGREDYGFVEAHEEAALLAIAHGDLARGRVFAQKAASIWTTLFGSDSPRAIKWETIAHDPSLHAVYGFSMTWKTAVGEAPEGLGPDDFEDWLWRTKRPKGQINLTGPFSQAYFTGFVDLPYTRGIGTDNTSRIRDWCFLGEIVETLFFGHLKFEIKDIHGKTIPLHFYTPGHGRELMPSQCQTGYTVAIFSALQYVFRYGPPGIRHEDPRMIKIFPLSLARMLELSNQFRRFSIPQRNNTVTCHGCGSIATVASMKRCSMCSSFWYCNQECQKTGWTEKSHKVDCKALRNPDLRLLFLVYAYDIQDPRLEPIEPYPPRNVGLSFLVVLFLAWWFNGW
ncbi:hypothetical protein E4U58_004831 [Claviceps cyperi]|nr:hypothetical protein E4U58_004831 [Claviceps cyperi]